MCVEDERPTTHRNATPPSPPPSPLLQWPWMATVAGEDGSWAITYNLPPGPSSSPPFTLTVSGSESPAPLVFDDVRWGDVWLCVGDSAMLLPAAAAIGGPAWLSSPRVAPLLAGGDVRLFPVAAAAAAAPQPDFGAGSNCSWAAGALACNAWQNATAANAPSFSALCLQVAYREGGGRGLLVKIATAAAGLPACADCDRGDSGGGPPRQPRHRSRAGVATLGGRVTGRGGGRLGEGGNHWERVGWLGEGESLLPSRRTSPSTAALLQPPLVALAGRRSVHAHRGLAAPRRQHVFLPPMAQRWRLLPLARPRLPLQRHARPLRGADVPCPRSRTGTSTDGRGGRTHGSAGPFSVSLVLGVGW